MQTFTRLKINHLQKVLMMIFTFIVFSTYGQNTCSPSPSNDKIFVGSSSLASSLINPGINTYTTSTDLIPSLTQQFNASKLQISHCLKNFVSSNSDYEMNDFSFSSFLLNNGQVKFLLLWNELVNVTTTISLGIQFLLVYDREQFLMGAFSIDTLQFLLLNQQNQVKNQSTFSRCLQFKDFTPATTIPNDNSQISIQLFIVGMKYIGSEINIELKNESYSLNSSQLSFTIAQNSPSPSKGLMMIYISYVVFDRNILSQQYKVFISELQIKNQVEIDYWMKGYRQIYFGQDNSVKSAEFYLYKINRLNCKAGCQGCVSVDNCINLKGNVINSTDECVVCTNGLLYNNVSQKCESFTPSCQQNQVWNQTNCVCKQGFVRINGICSQCPLDSAYNAASQSCQSKCSQNQTFVNNQCICKLGFYIVDGKCSKCSTGFVYDQVNKKCIVSCQSYEIFNTTTSKCDCTAGLYRIAGLCGKCSTGYSYNAANQSCVPSTNCGVNQTFVNGKCVCSAGFVIILGNCSKCPTGTVYNNLLQNCTAVCTGNRRILNGKCVCNEGFYQIATECGTCPLNYSYNSTLKSCIAPTCKTNQVSINGTCTCLGPYVNNVCQPCPSNTTFNSTSRQCMLNCPVNSYYNSAYKACVCLDGFYVIGQSCGVCPSNQVYDFSTRSCQQGVQCTGQYEVYFQGLCICDVGYYRIKAKCSTCPEGYFYNETIFDCQSSCPMNQMYDYSSKSCQCNEISGFYKINGTCQMCDNGTVFNRSTLKCDSICPNGQVFLNNKCSCPAGFYLINGACGICDIGTTYNSSTLKCDKICTDINSYYQNGRCFCYPPYIIVNSNQCQACPSGSEYDLATQSCKQSTPSNNQNIICNATSQIKTFNSTSGQYYCACDQANKYFFIYDRCGTCQFFTKYNPSTKSCELDPSSLSGTIGDYSSPISVGSNQSNALCNASENKILVNGLCKCMSLAIKKGSLCVVCPTNSSPNLLQNDCVCKSGLQMSANNVCIPSVKQQTPECPQKQVWNKVECVCIEQFYRINGSCIQCPSMTKFNGSTCQCQYGTYPQSYSSWNLPRLCSPCHQSCGTCSGPTLNQCLSCRNISHLLTNGKCSEQTCDIGYYYQNYSNSQGKCQKCSSYCSKCSSPLICTQCIDGFGVQEHKLTTNLTLKVCSEICGDGKRFQRDCDDGNTLDGDGCNRNCQIQSQWTCVGGTTSSKDSCYQVDPTIKAIIEIKGATIQKNFITQNVRLSYIPTYFLQTECSLCSNIFKITVTSAKVLPDSIKVNFIPKSKYQFDIEFKFNEILAIPFFKFGIQLNPVYSQFFNQWDMNQFYQVQIDSALLAKKDKQTYLRTEDIV